MLNPGTSQPAEQAWSPFGTPETSRPAAEEPRKAITMPRLQREPLNVAWAILAAIVSLVAHVVIGLLFLMVRFDTPVVQAGEVGETVVEEQVPEKILDLTNLDLGIDSSRETNYNVDRIEDLSVPGPVNPQEAVGILNAPEQTAQTLPPPPGSGLGTGAAPQLDAGAAGSLFGSLGGMGGIYQAGGFAGRSGATREKMVEEGGGNAESERAVALGLQWLALHQANDGSWSMIDYNDTTREKPLGQPGRVFAFTGGDKDSGSENKVAATAFALLPFLAAGQTHKFNKENKIDYSKTVRGGLDFLIREQKRIAREALRNQGGFNKTGSYDDNMYANGVAAIAMGEAYGMTSDPMLKESALAAMRYIKAAQHSEGGWRYSPNSPGDLSVVGWQVMALKSCEMGGLVIPPEVMKGVDRFLDSSYNDKGYGYSYTPGGGATRTMTAVGMLCRLYRGVSPRNTALLKAVDLIKKNPPAMAMTEYYYAYYATQVMHHMGGEEWQFWNLGPSGKGTDGMRDLLIKAQDKGTNPKKAPQAGSWAPTRSFHDGQSRVLSTAMALLSLEVYYRHLPLYRRDLGATKEMAAN